MAGLATSAGACAGTGGAAGTPAAAPGPAPVDTSGLPPAIRWTRTSAEHRALFLETYRTAKEQLREMSVAVQPGTWAVILDADETVLDNSEYQKEMAKQGLSFTPDSWNAWVRREEAPALPGAADFIRFARELGGRVVIVTNRDDAVCPETRQNLQKVQIRVDLVLCKPPGQGDKNPRFQAVEQGTTSGDLPALDVLMWIGDNIQDFPGLDQDIRTKDADAFGLFGRSWILLPNPMYGSWQQNPDTVKE